MHPTDMSLFELFERKRRYVVPLFQRAYVWDEEGQWEPLWQDILGRAEAVLHRNQDGSRRDALGNHFLGAIVLNKITVYGRQVDTLGVIDGQQRLTTLQLMLAAFRDHVRHSDERALAGDLRRLTENDGVREREDERFKVWPTNADRHDFAAAMSAGSIAELEQRYPLRRRKYARKADPRPRLIEAYLYFARSIQAFCQGVTEEPEGSDATLAAFSPERAHALHEAMRQHIRLVVIELQDGDDPQVIFESLNARGVPLLPSDLIRNFVFLRAAQQGENSDALYEQWWSEYDERPAEKGASENARFWKQRERQGRERRTRLDLFMYHYVRYRSLQDYGIGHLYQAFREWWDADGDRRVAVELQELRRHSDAFASLFVPETDDRLATFATRLRVLDTSTIYPVLLMLLVGGRDRIPDGDLDGILTDLESYLVRRMLCELGNKNYNRFFFAMLQRLRTADVISRGLIREILLAPEGSAGEWPDDQNLLRAWLEKPLYETLKPARCKMILEAIDQAMRTSKQESVTVQGPLTVEHVMPQGWAPPAWPEPAPADGEQPDSESPVERRNNLLHTLGNLTLLTQELNSSVSNGSYEAKRPEIAQQSTLRLNTYFQTALTWNEDEIEKRGRALFECARKVWPRPETPRRT